MRFTIKTIAFAVLIAAAITASAAKKSSEKPVSPTEDLMREHAVISRLLLIFDESARRLSSNADLSPQTITNSCEIIRRFVQDYHEKNEENYIFSPLEKKGDLKQTTMILRQQHQAGRRLIDQISSTAGGDQFNDSSARIRLVGLLQSFNRMYRPHKAREGSVVFPAFYDMTSKARLDKLGETFENQEHKLFGQKGFERIVDQVATIEKGLGIYDLSQFTPKE